jgi:hypothetical protein
MRVVQRFTAALCFLLCALTSVTASAAERTFDKKFSVAPGGTLTLSTNIGTVAISGTDGNELIVHAVLRGDRGNVDDFELTAEAVRNGVSIVGRRSRNNWFNLSWLFGGGLSVRYTIHVPRSFHVDVRTSGGDLNLTGFNGQTYARTSGGNIRVASISGDVSIHTSGGNVHGTQLTGEVRATTSGGDVELKNVRGPVNTQTSGGDIRLSRIDGALHARTSGGDVEVDVIGVNRGVDLRTSGGDVVVTVQKEFAATADLRTSGGDVNCDLPIITAHERDRHRRSVHGEVNGGGRPLTVRTSGGDIEIRLRS